jgi:hypothetical protein
LQQATHASRVRDDVRQLGDGGERRIGRDQRGPRSERGGRQNRVECSEALDTPEQREAPPGDPRRSRVNNGVSSST